MNQHLKEILHARDFAGPADGRRLALNKIGDLLRRAAESQLSLTPDQLREISLWAEAGQGNPVPRSALDTPSCWNHVILGRYGT